MARRIDLLAAAASLVAVAMAALYVGVMFGQGDLPLPWVMALLALGVVASADGARLGLPHRRAALLMAAAALIPLGLVAILSIGLPILGAGGLAAAAALRPEAARA